MCGCSTHQPVEAWPNVVNTQFLNLWPIFEDTFLFFSFLFFSFLSELLFFPNFFFWLL
ncbi:unnamed protein product [Penicillium nalgiovense]|nr:unnamed protein product [Penicillium nalgiovense]